MEMTVAQLISALGSWNLSASVVIKVGRGNGVWGIDVQSPGNRFEVLEYVIEKAKLAGDQTKVEMFQAELAECQKECEVVHLLGRDLAIL